jgi:GntR family transcriptional regulator, transcriptional repressor for pyruvate dehydrogenase complex
MTEGTVTFTPAQTRRAFDDIIDQVRDQLKSGDLRPGQKLPSERDFAVQLGVSRNTVREAIRMLEIAGLVTLKKGATGGAFIASSNEESLAQGLRDGLSLANFSIADLMESRIALETFIARRAAEEAKDEEIDELEALVEKAKDHAMEGNWPARLKAHVEFEEKLVAAARNPILALLIKPVLDLTTKVSLRIGPTVADVIWEVRSSLLDALRRRDPDAAEKTVRAYLELLHERWLGEGIES